MNDRNDQEILDKVKEAKEKYEAGYWDCKEELFEFLHDFIQSL